MDIKKSVPVNVLTYVQGQKSINACLVDSYQDNKSPELLQVEISQIIEKKSPPSHNMGAEVSQTQENQGIQGLRILIDWFTFTLPTNDLDIAFRVLRMSSDGFVKMDRGHHGYTGQYRCGNISVFYDGSPGMGIHVIISGQGCRYYESLHGDSWQELMIRVKENKGNFTRLDGAVDDKKGLFKISQIREKVELGEVRTVFKGALELIKYKFKKDGSSKNDGETMYFGSATSKIRVRIYDKAKEQGLIDTVWNRVELQMRDERANAFANLIIQGVCLGEVVLGVLKRYLNFVDPGNDKNKSRWKLTSWWDDFLGEVSKIGLSIDKKLRTVSELMSWVDRQVAPTLALIKKATGKRYFSFIQSIYLNGERRLKPRHLALLIG